MQMPRRAKELCVMRRTDSFWGAFWLGKGKEVEK